MKDALLFLVSSIVDNPKEVFVEEKEVEGIVTFTIKLAKEDIGKVIGKEGKVIRALRNAIKIKAIKENKRIQISLSEDL